jgi:hypothetical protein
MPWRQRVPETMCHPETYLRSLLWSPCQAGSGYPKSVTHVSGLVPLMYSLAFAPSRMTQPDMTVKCSATSLAVQIARVREAQRRGVLESRAGRAHPTSRSKCAGDPSTVRMSAFIDNEQSVSTLFSARAVHAVAREIDVQVIGVQPIEVRRQDH